jgi:hypothetical protein
MWPFSFYSNTPKTSSTPNNDDMCLTVSANTHEIQYESDIPKQQTFVASNNQRSAANVEGLLFNSKTTRSFVVQMAVSVKKFCKMYSQYELKGVQCENGWMLSSEYIGNDTKLEFSITRDGQIQYKSPDYTKYAEYAGYESLTFKFKKSIITV